MGLLIPAMSFKGANCTFDNIDIVSAVMISSPWSSLVIILLSTT